MRQQFADNDLHFSETPSRSHPSKRGHPLNSSRRRTRGMGLRSMPHWRAITTELLSAEVHSMLPLIIDQNNIFALLELFKIEWRHGGVKRLATARFKPIMQFNDQNTYFL
jgi:hypothetical protein